jgi:alcohol dehydrogenase (cytochrome c)
MTGTSGRGPASLRLADGRTLSGIVMAQSEFDATVLADGRFHLLARDGDVYREKPIAPQSDWRNYDGAPAGNRYSPLKAINTKNVGRLAPAWAFPMPNSSRLEATPVVVDGVMYMTGWNEVYALDATTGHQIWAYSEPHTAGILSEGGSGANRGATVAGDRLFAVTDRAHILAFNRFTGQKLWDVEMGSFKDSYSATGTPLVVGDLVISGTAGGEEGARGFIDAYRVATGERVWRVWTIPKRGEKGSETWIGQALEHGCGVAWLTGSYDPSLDLLYWAVGNPCPDISGEERMGDNLYTDSVLALSPTTGEMKWYYQFTPHDTHDWDAVQPIVMADEMWQGRPRKLLFQANRNGFFYVLDRTNGEVLLHEPFVGKQTWNAGFTKDGKPIINPASVSTPEGAAVCPGSGANWPAVSYNPLIKLFYVRASDSCTIYTSHEDPLGVSGNRWFGRGTPSEKAQQALAALLAGYPGGNFIRAIDPFTGKKVWDYPAPAGRSGVLSTAGGLVFIGGGGGLMALDAKTGKALWHANLGQPSQATAMTYMVGGTQYIALPGVGTLVAYRLP